MELRSARLRNARAHSCAAYVCVWVGVGVWMGVRGLVSVWVGGRGGGGMCFSEEESVRDCMSSTTVYPPINHITLEA